MTLLILVFGLVVMGALGIASAYDAAEGRETLGALVERMLDGAS